MLLFFSDTNNSFWYLNVYKWLDCHDFVWGYEPVLIWCMHTCTSYFCTLWDGSWNPISQSCDCSSQELPDLSSVLWDLCHCSTVYFLSLFNSYFMPQQCSTYQTVPTSTCSVYTPLSRCHHSYISCQVELASFSPSCCSTAKNKAPFCEAAMRLQSGPPQGLKLHFLTQWLHFQDSQANLGAGYSRRIRSRWCLNKETKQFLKSKNRMYIVSDILC